MPEVGFRRDELHADVLFTIAGAMDRHDAALHGLSGVVIDQDQSLPHEHDVFERKQSAMAIDRLRSRLRAESIAGVCFPVDGQRHRQCYAQCAAAFFATKVKQGHFDSTPNPIFISPRPLDQRHWTGLCLQCRVSRVPKRHSNRREVISTNLAHTVPYCRRHSSKTMAKQYHKPGSNYSTLVLPLCSKIAEEADGY